MQRQFLLAVILTCTSFSLAQRPSYGEACSKFQRCQSGSWLACQNSKCECFYPDDMIFSPNLKKCVSKAGSQCKFAFEGSDGQMLYQLAGCIEHAHCDPKGYCQCIDSYGEDSNGSCVPYRQFNQTCDDDGSNKCNSNLGLTCLGNKCQCGNTTSFSEELHQCLGLTGHNCIKGRCIENGKCDTATNKCICKAGYFNNSENICSLQQGLLQKCTEDHQCASTLKCVKGLCNCNEDVAALYENLSTGKMFCAGKAGSPCLQDQCVQGADCRYFNSLTGEEYDRFYQPEEPTFTPFRRRKSYRRRQSVWPWGDDDDYEIEDEDEDFTEPPTLPPPTIVSTCLCNEDQGYITASDKNCGKVYDSPCAAKNDCASPLVCVNKKCDCRYPNQLFSRRTQSCRSKIHGPCKSNGDCIERGFCKLFTNQTNGACTCEDGFVENSNRECDVKIGELCDNDLDCDSTVNDDESACSNPNLKKYAACIEGRCDCAGFARLGQDGSTCLTMVGGECNEGFSSSKCVENAICVLNNARIHSGICACNAGFLPTANYTCAANDDLNSVEF